MSGWADFRDGVLKPIATGPGEILKEGISDVKGVYDWGKGTVNRLGNLSDHTIDNVTQIGDSLTDLIDKLGKGLGDAATTPWLMYGAIAVGGLIVLQVVRK